MITKKLSELAEIIGGQLNGEDLDISGVASYQSGQSGDITFAENPKNLKLAESSGASALFLTKDLKSSNKPYINVSNPRYAFAMALEIFHPRKKESPQIHPTCVIAPSAKIAKNVYLGPHTVVEEGAKIEKGVVIKGLAYVGEDVHIGENSTIYSGVHLYPGTKIGKNVIIHSGTVIGSDGFGYVQYEGRHHKIPQTGRVVIGDNVEIGSNTSIDRATLGETVIGQGTKIDNLVQIAHNVKIGENCIIVSMTGIAGSTKIGDRVTIAAQVGIRNHVEIGSDSIIASRTGITKSLGANSFVSGYPARPHRETLKIEAAIAQLPEIIQRLNQLEGKK